MMHGHSIRFKALGTFWEIDTTQPLSQSLISSLHQHIEQFDKTYSRFRSESLVSRMSRQSGTYTFPDNAEHIMTFYRQLYDITHGKVTPLIGAMLERAGYDAQYSFKEQAQKQLPAWDEIMSWHHNIVTTTKPITLDIGAAGKGYLVDSIADLLQRASITEYFIDASGDIRHHGAAELRIGLEHPTNPSQVIGYVDLHGRSLCASAVNRRAWGKGMHHIFDPATKSPVKNIVATWVVASETMVADGLATALFFVDPPTLIPHFDFEYVRVHTHGGVDYSPSWSGELFS